MSQTTSLHADHISLNARMVPYAGWDMPVSYPIGTASEVRACRASAGLFDVSHMGELNVEGKDAEAFLQHITTNDVSKLTSGFAQYSLLLRESGGVIDDIIVYKHSGTSYFVVVNAGCHFKDSAWLIAQSAAFDVQVTDVSAETALIAVQGPKAVALVAEKTGSFVQSLERFHFSKGEIQSVDLLLSRTGYTGEDGFEIFCPWSDAPMIWKTFVDAGAIPCGLGARDVLRLEAAYPLYGHELDDSHTPLESGTGWAVKLKKGDFIGRASVLKQKNEGVRELLVGLKMTSPSNAIARDGYTVLDASGDVPIGVITSGTLSPTVGYGTAMARLKSGSSAIGTGVIVDVRGRKVQAEVAALPFYRNGV